jgi:hypothetical protein
LTTPGHASRVQAGWGRPEFSGLLATKSGANEAQWRRRQLLPLHAHSAVFS